MVNLDGRCDYIKGQGTNIPECNFDGGDCVQYNEEYPDCDVSVYDFNFIGGELYFVFVKEYKVIVSSVDIFFIISYLYPNRTIRWNV
jgi:hypothetical protein